MIIRRHWLTYCILGPALLVLPFVPRFAFSLVASISDEQEGGVHVPEPTWRFGTLASGGMYHHAFEIASHTDVPLSLLGSHSSCGCTNPKLPEGPIAPGQTGKIEVALTPGERSGPYHGSVSVRTNHPKFRQLSFSLEGSFQHTGGRLAVSPGEIFVELVCGGGLRKERLMLSRVGDDPLNFLYADCDIPGVTVNEALNWESPQRDSLHYTELEIVIPDVFSIGSASGIVTIHTRHDTMPSLGLPIHVSALSPVEVYPSKITLIAGSGGGAVGRVRVRHRQGKALEIAAVTLETGLLTRVNHRSLKKDTIELTYSVPESETHLTTVENTGTDYCFWQRLRPRSAVLKWVDWDGEPTATGTGTRVGVVGVMQRVRDGATRT